MNQNQNNVITMFQTTVDFLDAHSSVWTGTAAFADAVARVKTGLSAVDTAADDQETPITGIATDKQSLRDDLEEKALEIADQISALAAKTNNFELGAQVELTKSSLDKMDDLTLEQTAERVGTLANDNIGSLADYGVVAAEVTALNAARTAFAAKKTAPRMALSERKTQTDSLPVLIGNVRSIFRNEVDKMVTKKKKTAPEFHGGYFAARVIVNRPGSRPKTPATPPATPVLA